MGEITLSQFPLVVELKSPSACQELREPDSTARPVFLSRSKAPRTLAHCLIRKLDTAFRRLYGVREFSDRPHCLLRVAHRRADMDLRLADGTEAHRGDQILELHLWNEHLLSLPSHGAGLGRGNVLRRRMGASLFELSNHVASDPSLHPIEALRMTRR